MAMFILLNHICFKKLDLDYINVRDVRKKAFYLTHKLFVYREFLRTGICLH